MTCGNNVTHRSYPTMALCNQNLYRPSVQSFRALTRFDCGDSYWVPTSRDEYPDMRLSRLPQVDYVVSKQS